jgi:hypothetical protein
LWIKPFEIDEADEVLRRKPPAAAAPDPRRIDTFDF